MVNEETANPYDSPDSDVGGQAATTSDERTWAMLSHLLPLLGVSFLGPLIIWLVKKDESEFVADQAKESLNFQITVFLAALVCIPLIFVIIGVLLLPLIGIAALVLGILACIKAYEGEVYRYPWTLRLI